MTCIRVNLAGQRSNCGLKLKPTDVEVKMLTRVSLDPYEPSLPSLNEPVD